MSTSSKWDNATIEELKNLYINKQHTTNEIAKILGFTKNAIIGKIHRLNLNDEKADKETSITKVVNRKLQSNYGKFKLEDIEFGMCVWPEHSFKKNKEDRFTFCGHQVVNGKSYCQNHLSLVYLGTKKQSKASDINALNIYKEEILE
jgi:hypothetical protein